MRVRLQTSNVTNSKLPHLKAWFTFAALDETTQSKSIADLKNSICTTIKLFSEAKITFRDIDLQLDGFEMLDELPAGEALRDGDLLVIKRREAPSDLGKKRKADSDDSITIVKRPRLSRSTVLLSTGSSSSSSSSSPSSESGSFNSESESSTDSDQNSNTESSSSDSNSSKSPSVISSEPQLLKQTIPLRQNYVPPGSGSVKTRKRNIRRRLQKKREASGPISSVSSSRLSGANIAPLGPKRNYSVPIHTSRNEADHLDLKMFSLGNKNKKKGYKYAIAPSTTRKKVFTVPDSPDASAVQKEVDAESDVVDGALPSSTTIFTSARQTGLIPPSELQSLGKLPKNVFVTGVDVEKDLWSKKRKLRKQLDAGCTDDVDLPQYADEAQTALNFGVAKGEPALSNSLLVPIINDLDADDTKSALIWSVVESDFELFPQVTLDSLQNGKIIAWKALALNPETFSPEILLHIATVTAVFVDSAENASFSIRRLIRPGWEDLDLEDVEGTHVWEKVRQMGWRAVNELELKHL